MTLATLNHNMDPAHRAETIPKPIHIGKNVWIGDNASILLGVTIGDGAVIGVAAVVTKNIPEMSVAVGISAKVIKKIVI